MEPSAEHGSDSHQSANEAGEDQHHSEYAGPAFVRASREHATGKVVLAPAYTERSEGCKNGWRGSRG
jgi:hypothetical protein